MASGIYQNVDARIGSIIDSNTGEKIQDDFKKFLFIDLGHDVSIGKMYQFNNNYWLTINVDKHKTLAADATVKRCNNTLRWQDSNGAVYSVPCVLDYNIKLNRDYATAGSMVVIPAGKAICHVQFNSITNTIKPNQRFLFGNENNWTAYRIEGGGIDNYNNLTTLDNMSTGLLVLTLEADFSDTAGDDLVNGIANYIRNEYIIVVNPTSISGSISQTVQLQSSITLNGSTVARDVIWSSSDETIATIDENGLVTFISLGTCSITCSLDGNTDIYGTCSAQTVPAPVDTYQIIFDPDKNYVLEGKEVTWTVYLFKNDIQQSDVINFSLDSNTVPSANYVYTVLGPNSFKIKNYRMFLTDTLDVAATSGINTITTKITLRGPW